MFLPIPKSRGMERRFFQICVFLKFFFQHHVHKKILKFLSTNLHLIFFQLNLNSIQLNLNPIVKLNLVELTFNSICIIMLFMPQLHIGINYCFSLQDLSKKKISSTRIFIFLCISNAFSLA